MDANGTRFHLFLGYGDWSSCLDANQQPLAQAWAGSPVGSNASGLAWDSARAELTLQARLFQFMAAPKDVAPNLDQRRGAARDRYGNWYWIDESRRQILVTGSGDGVTADFWPDKTPVSCPPASTFGGFAPLAAPSTPPLLSFCGLAVTEEHYLVVGVSEPPGLLIFDLHAGGPPRQLFWPATIPFAPFDMAPMPGGGVWILDRDHRCYWALDRHFNVLPKDQTALELRPAQTSAFQPLDGTTHTTPAARFPGGISLDAASPLTLDDPIAIEALPDCTVLILERNPSQAFSLIYRYNFGVQMGEPVSTASMVALIEAEKQVTFRLVAHDFAFVPEHDRQEDAGEGPGEGLVEDRLEDILYVVAADGNQSFAFKIGQQAGQLTLEPHPDYLPMRLFGGKGLVTAGTNAYYDFGNGWIPLIPQPRPRYVAEAVLQTAIKDGREPDCVWHRLLLDACIPPETTVRIWSRAANDAQELAHDLVAWQLEPGLYQRGDGSEQPYTRTARNEATNSGALPISPSTQARVGQPIPRRAGRGTWELLLQRAHGRYLQLSIELRGNQRVTPRLHAMRIYYPRFSYLNQYLPTLYREDALSASFLDRFLANPEGFYTALEDKIAAVQMLFDVRSAPPETLDWLAAWFGIALDPAWDEARRRLFIRHAMDFFQYRGTVRGLLMALRLTLDECPDERIFTDYPLQHRQGGTVRIIEQYRTRTTPLAVLGDATELTGLRVVTPTARWQPAQGGAELHRRYGEFLASIGQAPVLFPIAAPGDATVAGAWAQFARDTLGFVPAATQDDLARWQAYLTRRYQRIQALNDAYGLSTTQQFLAFGQVPLPSVLPADGSPLFDWFQFEAIVLVMRRTAHQFSVLIPLPTATAGGAAVQRARLELAKRVTDLEKPAHTIFDVKFFWAMFRVGVARLGEDTLLDRGSRAPELMTPLVLGQGYLAAAYLAPGHPQNVAERMVIGSRALRQ